MSEEKPPLSDLEIEKRLRDHVRPLIHGGYVDDAEILEMASDYLRGEVDVERARPIARRVLAQELAIFEAEVRTWPDVTDCDRLDAAFAELESRGIVARPHFTCCNTCGHAEIGDEITKAVKGGLAVRGYTFFHMQDTESATEREGLFLNYGPNPFDQSRITVIGHEIEDVIKRHGLVTDWDGSAGKKIHVALDWKRRRRF